MGKILEYMDHPTLATLAQTSKAWRAVVYRTSVWQTWKPKLRALEYFSNDLAIPRDSHHNGTPTKLCFFSWIGYKLQHNIINDLPHKVLIIDDPAMFIDKVYEYWECLKKPCIHTNHHKWSHVFKQYHLLKGMSSAEIKRIGYRTTEFPTPMNTNPYRYWLMTHINTLIPVRIGSLPVPMPTDPLSLLYYKTKQIDYERLKELGKRQEEYCERFTRSIQALASIPSTEFHANEKFYEKNNLELLGDIVFSTPQDQLDLELALAPAPAPAPASASGKEAPSSEAQVHDSPEKCSSA